MDTHPVRQLISHNLCRSFHTSQPSITLLKKPNKDPKNDGFGNKKSSQHPINYGDFCCPAIGFRGSQKPRALHCNVARILGADLRCHWVTTLLLMMILAYVTGTHTIIFWEGLSSNSSTSSLFLSLFTFFFVARKAPSVALSHSLSILPGQITQY